MLGAGSAGIGIADLLVRAMVEEGMDPAEARRRFYILNSKGLLVEGGNAYSSEQQPFAHTRSQVADWELGEPGRIELAGVVRNAKPTMLIGVSGRGGVFTEQIVREMARHTERPLVFPLSNPTSQSEATPADIMAWTEGRALIGTGSPFKPVEANGRMVSIDQVNNSYIFPGMGPGRSGVPRGAGSATPCSWEAARALAAMSPAQSHPNGTLLPPVTDLREVSARVGTAVALRAHQEGLAPDFDPGECGSHGALPHVAARRMRTTGWGSRGAR